MLPALLLAACLFPPLFDTSGPVCTPARQSVECGCSECFSWDPVSADPPAAFYELLRTNPDNTTVNVGSTSSRNRPAYENESGTVPAVIVTDWCPPYDAQFPLEGATYRYQVRACSPAGCGPWSITPVSYTAAPYACYDGGREVACYPGDVVFRP